jgi:hypothetical protein
MIRENEDNHILKCRQLFLQYVVDMYAKIETERVIFIRLNQTELRSEEYVHLRDATATRGRVQLVKIKICKTSIDSRLCDSRLHC